MIAYKCTTIVRLSVDIEGCQNCVQCLDKRTILSFEAPSNGRLQSVDLCHLCFVDIINVLFVETAQAEQAQLVTGNCIHGLQA